MPPINSKSSVIENILYNSVNNTNMLLNKKEQTLFKKQIIKITNIANEFINIDKNVKFIDLLNGKHINIPRNGDIIDTLNLELNIGYDINSYFHKIISSFKLNTTIDVNRHGDIKRNNNLKHIIEDNYNNYHKKFNDYYLELIYKFIFSSIKFKLKINDEISNNNIVNINPDLFYDSRYVSYNNNTIYINFKPFIENINILSLAFSSITLHLDIFEKETFNINLHKLLENIYKKIYNDLTNLNENILSENLQKLSINSNVNNVNNKDNNLDNKDNNLDNKDNNLDNKDNNLDNKDINVEVNNLYTNLINSITGIIMCNFIYLNKEERNDIVHNKTIKPLIMTLNKRYKINKNRIDDTIILDDVINDKDIDLINKNIKIKYYLISISNSLNDIFYFNGSIDILYDNISLIDGEKKTSFFINEYMKFLENANLNSNSILNNIQPKIMAYCIDDINTNSNIIGDNTLNRLKNNTVRIKIKGNILENKNKLLNSNDEFLNLNIVVGYELLFSNLNGMVGIL